jgi:hypothetical protein
MDRKSNDSSRYKASLARMYALLCKQTDAYLHDAASAMGMLKHEQLQRDDLVRLLAVRIALQYAVQHNRGFQTDHGPAEETPSAFLQYMHQKAPYAVDPIMNTIIIDPLLVSSGICYERTSIQIWIAENTFFSAGKANMHTCPVKNTKIESYGYVDANTRNKITRFLQEHGVEIDMQLASVPDGVFQLWKDPSRDQVANPDRFFGRQIAKKLAKPKYLHPITVLNPKGWQLLWDITAENLAFNRSLKSPWDKEIHNLKWRSENTNIIQKLGKDYEETPVSFRLNKLELSLPYKIDDFAKLTKYISDNYVAPDNVAPLSAPLLHVFFKGLGFPSLHSLAGYTRYTAGSLSQKKAGFYTLKQDTSNGPDYFESVLLYE